MGFTRSISAYALVDKVLRAARAAGGGQYTLPSRGAATNWRAKAYYYRRLLAEQDEAKNGNVPGYSGVSPFDDMSINRSPSDEATLIISFGLPGGVLRTADGELIDTNSVPAAPAAPVGTDLADILDLIEEKGA